MPQSGSAFSIIIFVHRSAVTITGETAVFDDVGSSGVRVLRRYCPRCGSLLTTEPVVLVTGCSVALDRSEWASRDTGINASQVAANFTARSSRVLSVARRLHRPPSCRWAAFV
jgi:hypothetical protein